MKTFLNEFKEFINRGNVMDLAVGVIIGGAFSKIITSLVGDVIMPAVSLLTGRINFTDWAIRIPSAAAEGGVISISYGLFLQNIVDFLITALCIFLLVKAMNLLRRRHIQQPSAEPEPPVLTADQQLLTEIRDLLAERRQER